MDTRVNRRSLVFGALGAASLARPSTVIAADRDTFFARVRLPVGIQLYALGDAPRKDLEGTFRQLAAIGYRDLELPGLLGQEPAALRIAADAAGLSISSIHVPTAGAFSIRNDAGQIATTLGILGAKTVVVPMFPVPPGLKVQRDEDVGAAIARSLGTVGEDWWKKLAALLNDRGTALRENGLELGYHNHSVEFAPVGSRTGWDILMAETDPSLVHFEVDIGWLVSAGQDPLKFFRQHHGRIRQAHVKDVKRGFTPNTQMRTNPTEVGSGGIDWVRVLPAAYAAGVRHFYVEQEPPFVIPPMDAAAKSYTFLSQLPVR